MRLVVKIIASLILSLPAEAAPDTPDDIASIESITPYTQGIQALADHLPELAVTRFQEAYKIPGLPDAINREILYRLTEAQVRANMPDLALVTLKSKFFADHPERNFWLAQAYASQGKFQLAIDYFQQLTNTSKHYNAALLSIASLELAMGHSEKAIDSFKLAAKSEDEATKIKANTSLSEIHLNNGNLKEAKLAIDSLSSTSPHARRLKSLLDAKLLLTDEKFAESTQLFTALLDDPGRLPTRLYHIASLGLADSLYADARQSEALEELDTFIDEHPDSPLLLPFFERLTLWQEQNPTPESPYFLKLQQWAGRSSLADDTPITSLATPFIVDPLPIRNESEHPTLAALSHFFYAKLISQLGTNDSALRAQFEFSAFRLSYPDHPLMGSSLLETARIQLKQGLREDARSTLDTLSYLAKNQQVTLSNDAAAQAMFIAGLLNVEAQNYPKAQQAFEIASRSNNEFIARAASINTGLAALRSADIKAFDAQHVKITDKFLYLQLTLEKALWMAHQKHPDAKEALSNFLIKHPSHQRAVDARIALASICATQPPLDPLMCRALLDTIEIANLPEDQFTDYCRTAYQLAEMKDDWPAAISAANNFLERHPQSDQATEFSTRKGLALYRNGEHNKARQLLGKLAMEFPQSPLADFAYYYAAMAARLEGTPQALKESVDLFEKVITSSSALADEARIQQARVLIDLDRLQQAKLSLTKAYQPKSPSERQREIGILLAATYHILGNEDPLQYPKAIAIYDQLLLHPQLSVSWSNQLHFLKGQTLESMGELRLALDTYYRVINRENILTNTPGSGQEWKWFYQCGSKTLAMLENSKQYRAAVAVAKKIASYQGPESAEFSKRARALEMDHMIWDEQ